MLVLNDTQALIVQTLLTKMFVNDTYSVAQLEEAIAWFQQETDCGPSPFEQVWSKNLAQEIVRIVQCQIHCFDRHRVWHKRLLIPEVVRSYV